LAQHQIELDTGDYLKLLPHLHNTDGFFAAVFEKLDAATAPVPSKTNEIEATAEAVPALEAASVVEEVASEEVPAKKAKKAAVKKEPKPKVAKAPKDDSAVEPKVSKVKASTAKTKAVKA